MFISDSRWITKPVFTLSISLHFPTALPLKHPPSFSLEYKHTYTVVCLDAFIIAFSETWFSFLFLVPLDHNHLLSWKWGPPRDNKPGDKKIWIQVLLLPRVLERILWARRLAWPKHNKQSHTLKGKAELNSDNRQYASMYSKSSIGFTVGDIRIKLLDRHPLSDTSHIS